MINKRLKAGLDRICRNKNHISFSLGTFAIVAVCVMLLVAATFTQIKINFNLPESSLGSYLKFEYIPQIPIVLFIAALLGEGWGLISILLYIILGLTPMFPFFALGGGMSYIFQYNFGYIFAYIFAVVIAAKQLKNKYSIKNMLIAVLSGVLVIHIIGIIYMIIIALLRHDSPEFIVNWIYYQSIAKLLYDVVFGFIVVLVAAGIRKFLWVLIN